MRRFDQVALDGGDLVLGRRKPDDDLLRDRLNLKERGDALFALHRRWRPRRVGYEQYGCNLVCIGIR
jgi:hypothetical protein